MGRVTDEQLLQLVQEKGEEYWICELKKSRRAVLVFAAVFVVSLLLVLLRARVAPEFLRAQPMIAQLLALLPWVLVMAGTLYVGACQVRLLPFMNSQLLLHWLIVSVFAVVVCAAPLWLAMFAGSNSIAKRRLNEVVASLRKPDSV